MFRTGNASGAQLWDWRAVRSTGKLDLGGKTGKLAPLILMESTVAVNPGHISTSNGNPLQYCLENPTDRVA